MINHLYLKLPPTIAILVVLLLASFVWPGPDILLSYLDIAETLRGIVTCIDFTAAVLEGNSGLLPFAGASMSDYGVCALDGGPFFLMATPHMG